MEKRTSLGPTLPIHLKHFTMNWQESVIICTNALQLRQCDRCHLQSAAPGDSQHPRQWLRLGEEDTARRQIREWNPTPPSFAALDSAGPQETISWFNQAQTSPYAYIASVLEVFQKKH